MARDRAPSPAQIMRSIAAYQRLRQAFAADEDLAADEAPLTRLIEADPSILPPDELLDRMTAAIAFAEARALEARQFEQAMAGRHQRYAARAMVLRSELLEIMQALERKSYSGSPFGTVSVVRGKQRPVVPDEGVIPEEYIRTTITRTLDRIKLLADLKQGVVVEGASLSNGAPSLRFKGDKPIEEEEEAA